MKSNDHIGKPDRGYSLCKGLFEHAACELSCTRRVDLAHGIDTRELQQQLSSSSWLERYR